MFKRGFFGISIFSCVLLACGDPKASPDAAPPVDAEQAQSFARGDVNGDGRFTSADLIPLDAYINGTGTLPCRDAADANDDGVIDMKDTNALLFYGLGQGTIPSPHPTAGADPTADLLGCNQYPTP